jgi:hypothetical protein
LLLTSTTQLQKAVVINKYWQYFGNIFNRLVAILEPLMHPHFNPYATENWNQTMEKSGIG